VARILIVGKGPPNRGGIAAYIDSLLHDPNLGTHSLRLLNLAQDDVPRGGTLTTGNVRRTISDARALWKAAADADVVHLQTALVPLVTLIRAGLLALVARLRKVPVIVHAHSGKLERWAESTTRDRFLLRVALAPSTRVVAVSEGGRAIIARALGPRVVLLDNGVDTEAFAPAPTPTPHDPPRILFAGVLAPRKGVLDLFEASTILRNRNVAHEIWLAGGPPDNDPGAEETVRAAAPSGVRFLGPQSHDAMSELYRAADVFCLPSWWEAMPISILEAAASGLPVVATPVGDVPRSVIDGKTGTIVPIQDPNALAEALEELLRSPELRATRGRAGRDHVVAHFSAASTRADLAVLYDELA
jgi:glycosyltransferase involved in cell wall biosynthesis